MAISRLASEQWHVFRSTRWVNDCWLFLQTNESNILFQHAAARNKTRYSTRWSVEIILRYRFGLYFSIDTYFTSLFTPAINQSTNLFSSILPNAYSKYEFFSTISFTLPFFFPHLAYRVPLPKNYTYSNQLHHSEQVIENFWHEKEFDCETTSIT